MNLFIKLYLNLFLLEKSNIYLLTNNICIYGIQAWKI